MCHNERVVQQSQADYHWLFNIIESEIINFMQAYNDLKAIV